MHDARFVERMLDVIEQDIVPLTAHGVRIGCKVFGAAVLRRDDLSLVLAGTNHEALSPLWHGEIWTIRQFYEMQGHPDPADCVFLSTHQPCCMCASALAWSGFREVYYLFGYEHTGEDFTIPHDQRMIREMFGCTEPAAETSYTTSRSLVQMMDALPEAASLRARFERVRATYAALSDTYQRGEKRMVLK